LSVDPGEISFPRKSSKIVDRSSRCGVFEYKETGIDYLLRITYYDVQAWAGHAFMQSRFRWPGTCGDPAL